ncbi:MAG: HlyD family efflux transporter periplasmic adaptor subunit [Pseudomonadales bacterium]|nr:HlyD family efflux transporter periplasmic adaptor subunit [Pseudomonadales bacterium]
MSKQKVLPILVIIVVATCILALYMFKPSARAKETPNNAWRVSVQKAHLSSNTPQLSLIGQVESPRETTLASPSNAYVNEVLIAEGNLVKKGQLLVTLDTSDEKLRLAQREADVADVNAQITAENNRFQSDIEALAIEKDLSKLASKASTRYGKLAKRQVGSDVQWDESKQAEGKQLLSLINRELAIQDHPNRIARLQAQLARVSALRDQSALDLARTQITAPFNGRITKLPISPQNRLRTGDTVLTLYDTDAIEIRAQIPLKYLSTFELALQQQNLIAGNFTSLGKNIPITLSRLSGAIEKGKGGIDGLFSIAIDPQTLQAFPITVGRSLSISLKLPAVNKSIIVPTQAIYGQDRIYTVVNSLLVSHQIKRVGTQTSHDGSLRFLIDSANIPEGADILITQVPNAISGMEVQITNSTSLETAQHAEPTQHTKKVDPQL